MSRRRRTGRLMGALALGVTLLAGAAQADVLVGDRQDGAKIIVAPNSIVSVRLTANPATGYTWRMLGRTPALRLLSERYDAPPPLRRPVLMVGRPGAQSFRVRVTASPGHRVALRFAYRRWWTKVGLARVWGVTLLTPPKGR